MDNNHNLSRYSVNGPPSPLVLDPVPLRHSWLPDTLLHRAEQVGYLRDLETSFRTGIPSHFVLYGPAGTGKTLTVKFVLKRMAAPDLKMVFLTCSPRPLDNFSALAASFGIKMERGWGFGEIWRKVQEILGDSFLLLVLDEFDKAAGQEEFLFSVLDRPGTSVVAIANDLSFYSCISDQRILSRFSARSIRFPPYTPPQLVDILRQRAEAALAPGSWDEGLLSLIAALTTSSFKGNARIAIDLLWFAASKAEGKIREEDVRRAHETLSEEELFAPLKELTPLELVYLYSAASDPGCTLGEAKARGDALASSLGFEVAPYTGYIALRKLAPLFFQVEKKGRGRGKGVSHHVHLILPPEKVKERISFLLKLEGRE